MRREISRAYSPSKKEKPEQVEVNDENPNHEWNSAFGSQMYSPQYKIAASEFQPEQSNTNKVPDSKVPDSEATDTGGGPPF
jgi:hypothetical protein